MSTKKRKVDEIDQQSIRRRRARPKGIQTSMHSPCSMMKTPTRIIPGLSFIQDLHERDISVSQSMRGQCSQNIEFSPLVAYDNPQLQLSNSQCLNEVIYSTNDDSSTYCQCSIHLNMTPLSQYRSPTFILPDSQTDNYNKSLSDCDSVAGNVSPYHFTQIWEQNNGSIEVPNVTAMEVHQIWEEHKADSPINVPSYIAIGNNAHHVVANIVNATTEPQLQTQVQPQAFYIITLPNAAQLQNQVVPVPHHAGPPPLRSVPGRTWPARQCNIDIVSDNIAQKFTFPAMTEKCPHCQALHSIVERAYIGTKKEAYTTCCGNGKLNLPKLGVPSNLMQGLLAGQGQYGSMRSSFMNRSRALNAYVSFASTKMNQYQFSKHGVPTIRVSGKISHYIGPINPVEGNQPRNLQVFFHQEHGDGDNIHLNDIEKAILGLLREEISRVNPLITSFKTQNLSMPEAKNFKLILAPEKQTPNAPTRTHNAPTCIEVAAIVCGEEDSGDTAPKPRDIVLHTTGDELQLIKSTHYAYDALAYVLLHMQGERGWDIALNQQNKITPLAYYKYRAHTRDDKTSAAINYDVLLRGGLLSQQYWVDMWIKVEENNLEFIKNNQSKLKAESYTALKKAVNAGDGDNAGTFVALPSSVIGSPRHHYACFQDAMAIVRALHKPSLFITFTCNPNWPEITRELKEGEQPCDRGDIVVRVFHIYLKNLMDDLLKKDILGVCVAHLYTIEFQKRGLPHAHILLILKEDDRITDVNEYDNIVCTEIPDPIKQPKLYKAVAQHMLHGPCGTVDPTCPCMNNGECSKHYPKDFCSNTQDAEDSYPNYRRRTPEERSFTITKRVNGRDFEFDNRWVVPYNAYLLLKYDAHINVELCNSINAIKYIYKYVYKGSDRAAVELQPADNTMPKRIDEVKNYIDARYVSYCEAMWHLFGFEMHSRFPSVLRLAVHLEDQQTVYYEDNAEQAAASGDPPITTLVGYFQSCMEAKTDPSLRHAKALELTYIEFPHYFRWENKKWIRRTFHGGYSDQIGRIYSVRETAGDIYFLRMLLCIVKGATSFQHLRTYDGITYPTYKEACIKRGLLKDDTEWDSCLEEACTMDTNIANIRKMFVTILIHNSPKHPLHLWEKYKFEMSRDYYREWTKNIVGNFDEAHYKSAAINEALNDINDAIIIDSKRRLTCQAFDMPLPQERYVHQSLMDQYIDHHEHNFRQNVQLMNSDQSHVYDTLLRAIKENGRNGNAGDFYFIDAPGGTGKTFLFNTIISSCIANSKKVIVVAQTGIAALLLTGGRTVHSQFGVPIPIFRDSLCNFKRNKNGAIEILAADVIIWDEAPMGERYIAEAINRTLQLEMKNTKLFGGKIMIMAGDFRQNLPVIKKANRATLVNRTIKFSHLWRHVNILTLSINERIRRSSDPQEAANFSEFLMDIGNGKSQNIPNMSANMIQVPPDHVINGDINDLINWTYPDITATVDAAILTPLNDNVDSINAAALLKCPGESVPLLSADSLDWTNEAEKENYPTEFLNTITFPGMPPHKLELKPGVPLLLIRNISPLQGLCNGTRLIVNNIKRFMLEVTITNGSHAGKKALIPRITTVQSDNTMPFSLKRLQFPVVLAFAMTINKAQGQTLSRNAVYLPQPVFNHGQLYVALSRSGVPMNTKVMIVNSKDKQGKFDNYPGIYTPNIVYRELISTNNIADQLT